MKTSRLLAAISILVLIAAPGTLPGQLDDRLVEFAREMNSEEFVKVWISIEDNHDADEFKRSAATAAATRIERHKLALSSLKERMVSQSALVKRLEALRSQNRAKSIKRHWIVNLVEAEVTSGELASLAVRPDVDRIYLVPQVELIRPQYPGTMYGSPTDASSVGSSLTHINAPAAWALGYTGAGRLVCSFDTGVLGAHPALLNNWKGLDGNSTAAWFDPTDNERFPHTFPEAGLSFNHGTHTLGIMIGHDDDAGDTIGVAPDARWIAAGVIDIPGASILDAFEWAADPDDNPNTVSDVPDVINHSWGFKNASCLDVFYDAIEHTEALGIVNIFSAGNEGSAPMSIRNPADRANDSVDCFAVGALDKDFDLIWPSSSRGPSPCDLSSIKPNVVAPGDSIRSAWADGSYEYASGTSTAAPHLSGLVALLRQKNANATVDEIKTAILSSAQPVGPEQLPNNTFGWGEIDCVAALNALPHDTSSPSVRVYDFTHGAIEPGDTVAGTVVLQNLGGNATSVSGALTGSSEALTILSGSVTFGSIAHADTVRSIDSIKVVVSDTVTSGSIISLDFLISGDGFSAPACLHFLVEPLLSKATATHDVGRIEFTLSNYGVFGMAANSTFPLGGAGFTFDGGSNDLWEGGIMVGDGYSRVSSGVHSFLFDPDMDFRVVPGGNMQFWDPGPLTAQESRAVFDDGNAPDPLGLEIAQESFAFAPPNDDYIIIRYVLSNISGASLSNVHFGIFLDWDVVSFLNAGGYETVDSFAWMAYNAGSPTSPALSSYRGVSLLQGSLASAGAAPSSEIYPPIAEPPYNGNGFSVDEKFNILTSELLYAEQNKSAKEDLFLFMSAGPLTIPPGGLDTVSFAILAGDAFSDIADAASRAQSAITDVEDPDGDIGLPDHFVLYQNYPNPFNPTTVISFDMPRRGSYRLTILNMLGQTVHNETGQAQAGLVDVEWNGESFASGAYLYKLTIDGRSVTRKMMLLK